MKPSVHPPSSTVMNEMVDSELLQAVRELPQPEPKPALDAAILSAAAERAAEIRKARSNTVVAATKTPELGRNAADIAQDRKTHSVLERFSRWLLGNGEGRGHLWQTVAASVFIGVTLGFMMQVYQEKELPSGVSKTDLAMLTPPAAEATPPIAAREIMPEDRPAFAEKDGAMMEMEAKSLAFKSEAARRESTPLAIPPPASALPAQAPLAREAREEKRMAEEGERYTDRLAAEMPTPAAARARGVAAAVGAEADARAASPSEPTSPYEARRMQNRAAAERINSETPPETEIDTQLKRISELRRDKKEEEAEALLRQLRTRYPGIDIDKRLRQLETGAAHGD